MRVHRPAEQVAVAVHQVADPDQMVVEVAEVPLVLGRHAGEGRTAAHKRCEHVPLGGHDLAQGYQRPLHVEETPELLVRGLPQYLVLEVVDLVVEGREDREITVYQHVQDPVEDHQLAHWRPLVCLHSVQDVRKGRAGLLVDGHEEVLAAKAVHFHQVV